MTPKRLTSILPAATLFLAAAIFALDLATPSDLSVASLYVIVILISTRFLTVRGMMFAAGACVLLTVVAFASDILLLWGLGDLRIALWHRGVDIVVIMAATYLATTLRQTEVTLEATSLRLKLSESEALRGESEARRALALEAADIGTWDYDPGSSEIACDARCSSLLGLPPDADFPTFLSVVHPADRAQVDAAVRRALDPDGSGRYSAEYRIDDRQGRETSWIAAEGRTEFNHRQPVRMRGVVRDTSERKRAELHRELLVNELNHRVKNSLATAQALAQKTLRAEADPVEARARFTTRLMALARAHNVLTRRNWENADLVELVADAIKPHCEAEPDRVRLTGPSVLLSPRAALALYMAVYELGANAVKYGALSDHGSVDVRWTTDDDRLHLVWREQGGPAVQPPSRKGLGTSLIEQGLAGEFGAEAQLDYRPDGLVCTIDVPLSRLLAR